LVYKRTLLAQNTPGSQDFPVITTLGSLDSLFYYTPGSFFCKPVLMLVQSTLGSRFPGVFITGESRLHVVFITGELKLPGVLITGESSREWFWTPGSHFTDFKEHTAIFKGSIILKIDYRLL
jgi:hypothetical protein